MVSSGKAVFRSILPFLLCIPLLFLTGLPAHLALRMLSFALCAMPLNFFLLSGRATCLCTATFFGIGAYAAALTAFGRTDLTAQAAAFFASLALPLLIALLSGIFLCRLEGDLFSLATFCLSEAFRVLAEGFSFTGGARGFDRIAFSPSPFFAGLFFAAALLSFLALQASPFGLLARCCASSPEGAEASGISLHRVRLISFCAMAAVCGGGGFFYAGMTGYLLPADFSFQTGCVLLSAALLAGNGRPKAAALFAGLLALLEVYLSELAGFRLLLMALLFLSAAFGLFDFSCKRSIKAHETPDFSCRKPLRFLWSSAGGRPCFLHSVPWGKHRAGRGKRGRKNHPF